MPIWLINILIGLALNVVSTLAQQAFAPKQQARGIRGTVQSGGKVPLSFLIGTIGVPGKLEYRNTWGTAGGTQNAYLVDAISFGDLPISAFTALWVNGQEVTVEGAGHVTQGYPVTEYDNGSDHLWAEFYDGTQTVVSAYLAAKFGADADRPWTSDMIGRGVPMLTLTALLEDTLWSGFPTYMAQFEGVPLFDPRLSTAAGGSGSQVWGDSSTYAFSDNNLVIIYNALRGIYYASEHVWGGQATEYQMPYAEWAAAMDACDENVALDAGGTEKRFRGGREIFVNERPADVIQEFLIGANARLALVAGRYYPLVGVPAVADFTFTDDDVIVTEGTTLDCFPNLDGIVNGAAATFLAPEQAWEAKETAPYLRSDLEAEDDDRRQLKGIDLGTTFSGTQAQRVIKAAVEESRRFARHVVPLKAKFGQYRPLQVGAWTSTANGYSSKLFLVTSKTEDQWGRPLFGFQEIDSADHGWVAATDEQPLTFAPLTPVHPATLATAGFSVAQYTFVDAGSNARRPGILASWDGGLHDIRALQIEVRLAGETEVIHSREVTYNIAAVSPVLPIDFSGILPATAYEVRGKYLPYDGSGLTTDWSSWLPVTTPDVRIEEVDLGTFYGTGGDGIPALQTEIDQRIADITFHGQRLRSLVERVRSGAMATVEQDWANYNDKQTLRVELKAGDAAVSASATTELTAATGPGSAIALSIVQLEADVDDNAADIVTESVTRASEIEALSTSLLLVSAGTGLQFDPFVIWHFDTGIEGWTGNGTPTAAASFIRPAPDGADPYITSPTGLAVDGTAYKQVMFLVRKVGTPTWAGDVWWKGIADGTWDAGRRNTVAEPTYDANNTGVLVLTMSWAVTIDQIRMDFSTSSDGSNYFECHWVAIGRPSPGASTAALSAEQTARTDADSAMASDITALEVAVAATDVTVGGHTTAISVLDGRVDVTETGITAAGGRLDVIEAALGSYTAPDAVSDAIDDMQVQVDAFQGGITATGESVRALRAKVQVAAMRAAEGDISQYAARVDGLVAQATATQVLRTDVQTNADGVTVNAAAITAVDARLTTAEGVNTSQASALTSLDARVTSTESTNTSQATAITNLQSALTGYTGASAVATAISGLDVRVTSTESTNTAQAASITALQADVGDVSATGLFRVTVEATEAGASSTIGLTAAVSSGAAAETASILISAMTAGGSQIKLVADNVIVDGTFTASEIITPGTVDTPEIADNAVTDVYEDTSIAPDLGFGTNGWDPTTYFSGTYGGQWCQIGEIPSIPASDFPITIGAYVKFTVIGSGNPWWIIMTAEIDGTLTVLDSRSFGAVSPGGTVVKNILNTVLAIGATVTVKLWVGKSSGVNSALTVDAASTFSASVVNK